LIHLANVQLAAGIESTSIADDLNGFIIVLNTHGRIILLSDNVENYLRKNVVCENNHKKIFFMMFFLF
jgi:hypothetical protein